MTSSNDPDKDLAFAWAAGDNRAGAELYDRHHKKVAHFFASKVGEQWEELTQQTFFTAQECIGRFRGDSTFRTWLFGIAHNKLLRYLRDRGRDQQRFDPDEKSVADVNPSPASLLDVAQGKRLLLAALRRLPLNVQVMIELRYWEKMRIAEIAEIVEKPANTVKTQMRRGRQRLERLMEDLAETQEELESTRSGLEGWAERVRRECDDGDDDDDDDDDGVE